MKIFLDDIRKVRDIWNEPNLSEWVVVKSYKQFIDEVQREFPSFISFDHDLADEHYHTSMYLGNEEYAKARISFKEKTGLECAKWLIDYCIDNDLEFPKYHVHSANPVGAENIRSLIECFNKFKGEKK